MKTLLITYTSGKEIRAEVNDKATVTFGGLIPGAKVDGGQNRTALRIYEGKIQVAVFTGIDSFRFVESVSVLEKRTQNAVKSVVVQEGGVEKVKNVSVSTEEWVNPDVVKPTQKSDANAVFDLLQIEVGK